MARKSPEIQIEETGGNQFASLASAQRSARVALASDMAELIKGMIEQGSLEIRNGQIIPKGK